MKKIFTVFAFCGLAAGLNAQTFTVTPQEKTSYGSQYDFELVVHGTITNTGTDTVFTWKRIVNALPNNWQRAICDNQTCWAPEVFRNTIYIPNGGTGNVDAHFYPFDNTGTADMEIMIWVGDDSTNADTVRYSAQTWATNVSKVKDQKEIEVYPNPSNGSLTVKYDAAQPVKIEVYNLLGKKVAEYNHQGQQSTLDVSSLPNGVYVLHIQDQGKRVSRTFKKVN